MAQRVVRECKYGIVCVTPDSLDSRWLLFEAGALALKSERHELFTLLCGLSSSALKDPLASYQHTNVTHDEVFKLVQKLNGCLPKKTEEKEKLPKLFEELWPRFAEVLEQGQSDLAEKPPRDITDMVEETLVKIRDLHSLGVTEDLHLLTAYVGEFPFSKIRDIISRAERRIQIICDFLAYGTFTDRRGARDYRDLLASKARGDGCHPPVDVEIIVPNRPHQRRLEEMQFGRGHDGWSKLTSEESLSQKLSELNDVLGADHQITCMDDFHNYFRDRERRVKRELKEAGVVIKPVKEIPTTFCWVVDGREAVLTVPLFGQDASEQGFRTCDWRLLKCLTAMCRYYMDDLYLIRTSEAE